MVVVVTCVEYLQVSVEREKGKRMRLCADSFPFFFCLARVLSKKYLKQLAIELGQRGKRHFSSLWLFQRLHTDCNRSSFSGNSPSRHRGVWPGVLCMLVNRLRPFANRIVRTWPHGRYTLGLRN